MASGVTSLSSELARAARKEKPRDPWHQGIWRWLVLALVYLLVVGLTSPFYLRLPIWVEEAPGPDALPVIAETPFDHTSSAALRAFESERQLRHTRVYTHYPRAGAEALRTLDQVVSVASEYAPGSDDPDLIVSNLRRTDPRLTFITPANVEEHVQTLRDPRFLQSVRQVLETAYNEHVVVRNLTTYLGYLQDNVVSVVHEDGTPVALSDAFERPLPLPTDWVAWARIARPLNQAFEDDPRREEVLAFIQKFLAAIVQPNLRPNEEATRQAFEAYPQRDIADSYEAGDVLLGEEDLADGFDRDELSLLEAHRGALVRQANLRLLGHAAYVLIVFFILAFYVRKFRRDFEFNINNLSLISLPILLGLGLQGTFLWVAGGDVERVGYLFPAGAIGMLAVLLLDVRMALLLVTWGCLLFGLQVDLSYEYVIVGLFGGYTAVAAVYTIRKRWEVFAASFLIGLVNALVIMITSYIADPSRLPVGDAALGLFAGIGSFLVLAILPAIERLGILTDMQLLELTGLEHPLLRQLEEKAPGSWQHTLNVAKLAEAAASEIGVNYLLVRAGCYFHDIGKMKKPQYFTENQITHEDKMRHDSLQPIMSARVIMNHVKEGVEMARAARLPERIIDFIVQHHGTTLIQYFYRKATEAESRGAFKEPVRESDYRYPGVKPQTIEAAIVMLADSVEATATARLSARTVRESDIQQLVRQTVTEKFEDGQFNECNLTLRDLDLIRSVFVRELKSRFHTRIDYPKSPAAARKEEKGKARKEGEKKEPREGEKAGDATADPPRESSGEQRKQAPKEQDAPVPSPSGENR